MKSLAAALYLAGAFVGTTGIAAPAPPDNRSRLLTIQADRMMLLMETAGTVVGCGLRPDVWKTEIETSLWVGLLQIGRNLWANEKTDPAERSAMDDATLPHLARMDAVFDLGKAQSQAKCADVDLPQYMEVLDGVAAKGVGIIRRELGIKPPTP